MRATAFLLCLLRVAPPAYGADIASRTLLLDAALAGGNVLTVGERGTILRSTDNGRTWLESSSHTTATLTAISFADEQNGWVVGHDAVILVTHDGGVTWSKQWQGDNLQDSFLDVLALDARHVIAIGAYDLCVVTKDGGVTWTRRKLLADDFHLNRISRGPTGTLYIAGEHGTLLRSVDHGASWQPIPTSYDGSFYGVLALGRAELLAYGLRGRAFRSEDDGGHWAPVETKQSSLIATAVRLRNRCVVLGGQMRVLLVAEDLVSGFAPRAATTAAMEHRSPVEHDDPGGRCAVSAATSAAGIAELLELPDGNLLAVGEAGAGVISVEPLSPSPDPKASPDETGAAREAERVVR